MSRRSGRGYINPDEALEKLGSGRSGAVYVLQKAKIGSPEYRAALSTVEAIDDLVELITGDREHFHNKMAPARIEEN